MAPSEPHKRSSGSMTGFTHLIALQASLTHAFSCLTKNSVVRCYLSLEKRNRLNGSINISVNSVLCFCFGKNIWCNTTYFYLWKTENPTTYRWKTTLIQICARRWGCQRGDRSCGALSVCDPFCAICYEKIHFLHQK